ncbi:MAG: N-acetylmuramidase domain-containing protein [Pseudonocardiaceae bacterium]
MSSAPRRMLIHVLGALDPATLELLLSQLAEASPADRQRLREVLADLAGPPPLGASDRIELAELHALDRLMAEIYNTKGQYLAQRAQELEIPSARAAGIMRVESGGETFSDITDKPLIRFEAHVFLRTWGEANLTVFNQHYDFDRRAGHNHEQHRLRTDPGAPWISYHEQRQQGEWAALTVAESLAGREIAYQSISSGAGQIIGFNHTKMGYPTAVAMFEAFARSERAQVGSIFEFIARTPGLAAAVRAGDYEKLVKSYNGAAPGSPRSLAYQTKLITAEQSYARVTAGRKHVIP